MRIQELESIITRERAQTQGMISVINQETQQECAELRERGDRIIVEASQAIAEKDSQQSQETEMITDEAMVLKRRNETLIYELGQSQHDVIQATQYAQVEHWSLDLFKTRMIEEENSIRNLSGELTVAQNRGVGFFLRR